MRFLAFRTLRARWVSFAGLFLTVVTAAALVVACGRLVELGIRGGVPPERLDAVDLVVSARQSVSDGVERVTVAERVRVDTATVEKLRSVSGVSRATPEVSFTAQLLGPDGSPLTGSDDGPSWGHSWSSADATSFDLVTGRPPSAPDEIVVDLALSGRADLSVGDAVDVLASGRRVTMSVVGIASWTKGALERQAAVFFDDATALDLYGHPGQFDYVMVDVRDGADQKQVEHSIRVAAGPGFDVLSGRARGRAEFVDTLTANLTLISVGAVIGAISLFTAVFVVSGMSALIVQQRQRELALLRTVAATKKQVRRMIRMEMVSVSLLGAVAGLWPGARLATTAGTILRSAGAVPEDFRGDGGFIPALLAAVVMTLTGLVGGSVVGWRATRVRPVEALREAAVEPRRLPAIRITLGSMAALVSVALFMLSLHVRAGAALALTPARLMSLLVVVVLFSPLLTGSLLRLVGVVARVSPVGGYLAVANLKALTRRMAAAVMPVALLVTIAASGLFQQTTLRAATAEQSRDRLIADHAIVTGFGGMSIDDVGQLAHQPGVETAVGLLATTVYVGDVLVDHPAVGVTSGRLEKVLDLDLTAGSSPNLGPADVALSTDLAAELGVHPGATVPFRLGDGTRVEGQVAAVFARSLGFADMVVPMSRISEHVTEPLVTTVLIRTDATTTTTHWEAFEREHPGVRVSEPDVIFEAETEHSRLQALITYTLHGMVFLLAAIALVNTLIVTTTARKSEFAALRLLGATSRQIRRIICWEAVFFTLMGCLIGGAVAVLALAPYSGAITGSFVPVTPIGHCVALAAVALTLVLAGTLLPARLASPAHPIDAVTRHG